MHVTNFKQSWLEWLLDVDRLLLITGMSIWKINVSLTRTVQGLFKPKIVKIDEDDF
jgi:hypothetical protein